MLPVDSAEHPELLEYHWEPVDTNSGADTPKRYSLDPGYPCESLENVEERISSTWLWLGRRSEHKIAVFTHFKFLGSKGRDYGLISFLGLDTMVNAGVCELQFSPHGWRVLDPLLFAPGHAAPGSTGGLVVAGDNYAECASLQEAREVATRGNKCVVQEEKASLSMGGGDVEGDSKRYLVKNVDSLGSVKFLPKHLQKRVRSSPGQVHVAPVDVCIGIGCPQKEMHAQRVARCVQVMKDTPTVTTLVWTDSESGLGKGDFFGSLGKSCTAAGLSGQGAGGSMRVIVDSRAKSTLGHARFSLERVLSDLLRLECHVRVHLVTSDFHMERARMVFQRACAAMLVTEGHNFELVCCPCVHSGEEALAEVAQHTVGDLHLTLEERQRQRNRQVVDDDVWRLWE